MGHFKLFVVLPTEEVCTLRDVKSGTSIRDIRSRLEICAGLPSQVYTFSGKSGQVFQEDDALELGLNVWDGFLLRVELKECWNALLGAVRSGDIDLLKRVKQTHLHSGVGLPGVGLPGVGLPGDRKETLDEERDCAVLYVACWTGSIAICQDLLKAGVNPNSKTQHNRTPIFAATVKDNYQVMETLLKHGALLSVKDCNGDTPLDIARQHFSTQCINTIRRAMKDKFRTESNSSTSQSSLRFSRTSGTLSLNRDITGTDYNNRIRPFTAKERSNSKEFIKARSNSNTGFNNKRDAAFKEQELSRTKFITLPSQDHSFPTFPISNFATFQEQELHGSKSITLPPGVNSHLTYQYLNKRFVAFKEEDKELNRVGVFSLPSDAESYLTSETTCFPRSFTPSSLETNENQQPTTSPKIKDAKAPVTISNALKERRSTRVQKSYKEILPNSDSFSTKSSMTKDEHHQNQLKSFMTEDRHNQNRLKSFMTEGEHHQNQLKSSMTEDRHHQNQLKSSMTKHEHQNKLKPSESTLDRFCADAGIRRDADNTFSDSEGYIQNYCDSSQDNDAIRVDNEKDDAIRIDNEKYDDITVDNKKDDVKDDDYGIENDSNEKSVMEKDSDVKNDGENDSDYKNDDKNYNDDKNNDTGDCSERNSDQVDGEDKGEDTTLDASVGDPYPNIEANGIPLDGEDSASRSIKDARPVTAGRTSIIKNKRHRRRRAESLKTSLRQAESLKTSIRQIHLAERQKWTSSANGGGGRETFESWLRRKQEQDQRSPQDDSDDSSDRSYNERNSLPFATWLKQVRDRPNYQNNSANSRETKSNGLIKIQNSNRDQFVETADTQSYMHAYKRWRERHQKSVDTKLKLSVNEAKLLLEENRQKTLAAAITFNEWMTNCEERKHLTRIINQSQSRVPPNNERANQRAIGRANERAQATMKTNMGNNNQKWVREQLRRVNTESRQGQDMLLDKQIKSVSFYDGV